MLIVHQNPTSGTSAGCETMRHSGEVLTMRPTKVSSSSVNDAQKMPNS